LLSPLLEELKMAYVITEPCIGVKDTGCVDVCPVDCIHPRKDEMGFVAALQLYIEPDECIEPIFRKIRKRAFEVTWLEANRLFGHLISSG
jgi:NAD-dependent dihydropyrimidine dehydrogenase PreA subunit